MVVAAGVDKDRDEHLHDVCRGMVQDQAASQREGFARSPVLGSSCQPTQRKVHMEVYLLIPGEDRLEYGCCSHKPEVVHLRGQPCHSC